MRQLKASVEELSLLRVRVEVLEGHLKTAEDVATSLRVRVERGGGEGRGGEGRGERRRREGRGEGRGDYWGVGKV